MIKVIDYTAGTSAFLGIYDSALELSLDHPINIHGTDMALAFRNIDSDNASPIFYQIVNGITQEIRDPRIFVEDIDLLS